MKSGRGLAGIDSNGGGAPLHGRGASRAAPAGFYGSRRRIAQFLFGADAGPRAPKQGVTGPGRRAAPARPVGPTVGVLGAA